MLATIVRPPLLFGVHQSRLDDRIVQALADATPWLPHNTVDHDSWTEGRVRLDVVTNERAEGRDRPLIERQQAVAAAWTGYIHNSGPGPMTDRRVAELNGIFALIQADHRSVRGWTAVHRLEPLYMAEGRHVIVLSTSARLAHAVAQTQSSVPVTDAMLGLSGPGYMISDATPFPGVTAVPANSSVTITSRVQISSLSPPPVTRDAPLNVHADAIAEALLHAAENIGRQSADLVCHITGGKDSRLALAAFAAAGVDVTAVTSGFLEHPDAIVGRRIASLLGIRHRQREPGIRDGALTVSPVGRAFHALRAAEGMITCYEAFNSDGSNYSAEVIECGGHGGELLRGGFGYRLSRMTPAQALRRLELVAAPHAPLLTGQGRQRLDALLDPWKRVITDSPASGLEKFYRSFRAGRWHAVARSAYSLHHPVRSVLADNQVVRLAANAPQEYAWDERLAHAVLSRICPPLCQVPFFKGRWNFERSGPSDIYSPEWWDQREPIAAVEGIGGFNWRIRYPPAVHAHFRDVILSNQQDSALFGLLDRAAVRAFLESTADSRSGSEAKLVWSIYTAQYLCTGLAESIHPPNVDQFIIPLPDS